MHDFAPPRAQREPHVSPGGVRHDAADMSATVAADVTLGDLQSTLADAGQWAALDGEPNRAVGDLAKDDSTGPLRLGYGGWRDVLTGAQFRGGDGDLVTVGGVAVKNVAGYDLVKFMIGSHGCFGEIVTLTLRTYRRPEFALLARLAPDADYDLNSLLCGEVPPQWTILNPGGLYAYWYGSVRAIEEIYIPAGFNADGTPNRARRRRFKDAEEDRQAMLNVGPQPLKISVAPADVATLIGRLRPERFAADPVFGVVWLPGDDDAAVSDALAIVRGLGGHAIWFKADGVRTSGLDAATRRVLLALKSRLDPSDRLPPLPIDL